LTSVFICKAIYIPTHWVCKCCRSIHNCYMCLHMLLKAIAVPRLWLCVT